jgi:hypothetical protein
LKRPSARRLGCTGNYTSSAVGARWTLGGR